MLFSTLQIDKAVTTSQRLLMSNNPRRVSLTFFPPQTGTCTVGPGTAITATTGITLTAGMSPVYVDVRLQGEAVQQEWYIFYTSGATPISFIESIEG